jgi:hypothetical protein
MTFDPFSSGGRSHFGSHVSFAPTPIGPEWNPAPNTWQPAAPPPAAPKPVAPSPVAPSPVTSNPVTPNPAAGHDALPGHKPVDTPPLLEAPPAGQTPAASQAEAMAQSFAQALLLQSLTETTSSPSTSIANKLPGAPGNVYGQMQELRDQGKLVDSRRELAQRMARKDDDINYRS